MSKKIQNRHPLMCISLLLSHADIVVVHLSDHNRVMVAQVYYYIRANYSINAKGKLRYLTKLFIL
jgi:hypothetical protein